MMEPPEAAISGADARDALLRCFGERIVPRPELRWLASFAGNRDEFHARRSAPAAWWSDAPDVFGGRDLEAGGSWLGITRAGRLAVVTNQPGLGKPDGRQPSRGELVHAFLQQHVA